MRMSQKLIMNLAEYTTSLYNEVYVVLCYVLTQHPVYKVRKTHEHINEVFRKKSLKPKTNVNWN
jgi:hypothetical protein